MAESRLHALSAALRARQARSVEHIDRPEAAVALILAPDPDRVLLIRRADREGDPWSGHLALPGGRRDATDQSLLDTAIRETREETGVLLEKAQLIAQLDDLMPSTITLPPLLVRPFAFVLPAVIDAGISDEVAGVAWVPLELLAQNGALIEADVPMPGGPRRARGYQLASGFLWGITERIVTPIVAIWASAAAEPATDAGDRPSSGGP